MDAPWRHRGPRRRTGCGLRLAGQALLQGEYERLASLRDRLADRIAERIPGRVHVYGHPTRRLPNTVNLRIDGVPALQLLASTPGVAASAGSACHAGRDEPSGVLTALGLDSERALSAIRLSLGRWTGVEDVDRAVERIAAASAIIQRVETWPER